MSTSKLKHDFCNNLVKIDAIWDELETKGFQVCSKDLNEVNQSIKNLSIIWEQLSQKLKREKNEKYE